MTIAAEPNFSGIHNLVCLQGNTKPKIMAISILLPPMANPAAAPFESFADEWVGVAAEEAGELSKLLSLSLLLDEVGEGDEDEGVPEAPSDGVATAVFSAVPSAL